MKSREMFRLAIKIFGFIVLLQGLRNCAEALMILMGYANPRLSTTQYWAAWAIIKIVAGVYLMVGVTPFVNLAFPMKPEATTDATETAPNTDEADAVGGNARSMDPR